MKTKQQIDSAAWQPRSNLLTSAAKMSMVLPVIILLLFTTHIAIAGNVKHSTKSALIRPTAENALAADQRFSNALLANDADAMGLIMDDDWTLVNAGGGMIEGIKTGWIAGMKSGDFSCKTRVVSEQRVRLYGSIALVTTHIATSGMFKGKIFDDIERQTNIFIWRKGAWKAVLSQVTSIKQ